MVIVRIGERNEIRPETWWPQGVTKPTWTVGLIHTHQVAKRADPGVPQDPGTGGHERGPSDQDNELHNSHKLPGEVVHWKDDPSDPENDTKPKKWTRTVLGPEVDDEIGREIDRKKKVIITWTDMRTRKLLTEMKLPKECEQSCPKSGNAPAAGK